MPPRPSLSFTLPAPLSPLRHATFRMLWGTWLTANLCMWMNDVAAAWMMTSLTREPVWVALVQTASTLPVFLLGLPSGALADILDRRRYFVATQFWVAGVALAMCVVMIAGGMTPTLLLVLIFTNGIGLAMRWPVFAAIVPELVPRAELPMALGLNGIAMNASRIAGPLLAGAVIAGAGTLYVFALNALLSIAAGIVIMRWRHTHVPSPLGREPLGSAIRVGIQFVRQSPRMKSVLVRVAVFFFHSTALLALLPLVAHGLGGGATSTFTVLLACMGVGAVSAVLMLPRIRRVMDRDALVRYGALLHAAMTAAVGLSANRYLTMAAMACSGIAWIAAANSLSVTVQLVLPDWVRARGMAIYQMALMGGSATGAAVWGNLASHASVRQSLLTAAACGAICMLAALKLIQDRGQGEAPHRPQPYTPQVAAPAPEQGRIVVGIAYRIAPERANEFKSLMQESRRGRLGQGALDWELLEDINEPGLYIEQVIDVSWTEHLRRFDRFTEADANLKQRKMSFHIGDTPPVVTRRVVVAT